MIIIAIVGCCLANAKSQVVADPRCGIFEAYDRLLPASVDLVTVAGATEVVLIRYIPGDTSAETEFRVTFVVDHSGAVTATVVSPEGPSLLSQMRAIETGGTIVCTETLGKVRLRSFVLSDQRVLKPLMQAFHSAHVPTSLESAIYLDAPRYEILARAGMNSASYVLYGPSSGERTHPLIRWVRQVASAIKTVDKKASDASHGQGQK